MTHQPDPYEVLAAVFTEPVIEAIGAMVAEAVRQATPVAGPAPEFIDTDEAASILLCTPHHVRRLYKRGDLTRYGQGRRVLLSREEVIAYARG